MPTIIEVAEHAGVSKSTASRVLTGDPRVSEDSKARVTAAAAALGYRANPMASALRGGKSRLIGLVVTNLVNASVLKITEVIEARAHAQGYAVLLGVTGGDPARESAILEALLDHRIGGLIIMQAGQNCDQINGRFSAGLPVVNLIREPAGSLPPSILPDNAAGAHKATRHLIELGHTRIGFIGGHLDIASGKERYEGYKAALKDSRLPAIPKLVRRGPFEPEFGRRAILHLLKSGEALTALLVANHEALFGVLPALLEEGVDIPGDLSLVGFEDSDWFQYWHPPVTIVDINPKAIADAAFDTLESQMHPKEGSEPTGAPPRPAAQLLLRRSSGAVASTSFGKQPRRISARR